MTVHFCEFLVKLCILSAIIVTNDASVYERTVIFSVFKNQSGDSVLSTFNNQLDCDRRGKFAFVIHGWEESIKTGWVMDTINNLTYHRGGCVIFMDYSRYSKTPYTSLATHFHALSKHLLRKIKHVSDDYGNIFLYGFSFGARIALETGTRLGYQLLERIDACDPAGPAFDGFGNNNVDPKFAARSVNCINTSVDKGTNFYDCHINFRMGICGRKQVGASRKPCGSHGLCPYYYNSAFDNKFLPDNIYNCSSNRMAVNIPSDFRMGYMESRKSFLYYGDVFIPTTKHYPWNVVRNYGNNLS